MFQFTGFPPYGYGFTIRWLAVPAGFPHSDICGSMLMCSSPQLFAAYHVFHRLSVPRHPPCALLCLTFSLESIWFCFGSLLTGLAIKPAQRSFGFSVFSLTTYHCLGLSALQSQRLIMQKDFWCCFICIQFSRYELYRRAILTDFISHQKLNLSI